MIFGRQSMKFHSLLSPSSNLEWLLQYTLSAGSVLRDSTNVRHPETIRRERDSPFAGPRYLSGLVTEAVLCTEVLVGCILSTDDTIKEPALLTITSVSWQLCSLEMMSDIETLYDTSQRSSTILRDSSFSEIKARYHHNNRTEHTIVRPADHLAAS